VKNQNWDSQVKDELLKKLAKYPDSAMDNFGENVELLVIQARKDIRQKALEKEKRKCDENSKEVNESREANQAKGNDIKEESSKASEGLLSELNNDSSEDSSGRSDVCPPVCDGGGSEL
jgi:hypothetical protein